MHELESLGTGVIQDVSGEALSCCLRGTPIRFIIEQVGDGTDVVKATLVLL
jgi:hypothetical protein